jgi:hypothetical protein
LFVHTFSPALLVHFVVRGSIDSLPPSLRRHYDAGAAPARR